MSDSASDRTPPDGSDQLLGVESSPETRPNVVMRSAAEMLATPIALQGAIFFIAGAVLLLVPGLATTLTQIVLTIALAASGIVDMVFSLSGRMQMGHHRSRWAAAGRGLITLLTVAAVVVLPFLVENQDEARLGLLVDIIGIYVFIRGLGIFLRGAFRRSDEHRMVKITAGVTLMALGAVASIAAVTTASVIIATGAMAAMIIGLVMMGWSLRRNEIATELNPRTASVPEVLWDYVRGSDVGKTQRREIAKSLYFEPPDRFDKLLGWWALLVMSVAISTFAVLADSTASVIGAMLVAPLMVPILGIAGALVNGWSKRSARSATLVLFGVIVSIAVSYGLATWVPVGYISDTNSQIAARVAPTLLDMLIALAAGAAGAFATVNTRVSASIAGVAIAVALVPPLTVVGIELAQGDLDGATGALVLFVTNFAAVILAAAVVFVMSGFANYQLLRARPAKVLATALPVIALAAVVVVPLTVTTQGILTSSLQQEDAVDVVDEWLGEDSDFLVSSVTVRGEQVLVSLRGPQQPADLESLRDELSAALGSEVELVVTTTPVLVETVPVPGASSGS